MNNNKFSIPKGMRDFNSDIMQKRGYIFEIVMVQGPLKIITLGF